MPDDKPRKDALGGIFANAKRTTAVQGDAKGEVELRTCGHCGAPRAEGTNLRVCTYCGADLFPPPRT